MREIKGIIFDMDGTLVNNIPYHLKAWKLFLEKNGLTKNNDEVSAGIHGTNPQIIRRFLGEQLSAESIQQLGDEKEKIYRQLYQPHLQEIAGLSDFLSLLKNSQACLGLATMSETENVEWILNALEIKNHFSVIIDGASVKMGKPDPEVYLMAIQKMQLRACECLAIEDSVSGVLSAKSAGLKVIGISSSLPRSVLLEAGCIEVTENYHLLSQSWNHLSI